MYLNLFEFSTEKLKATSDAVPDSTRSCTYIIFILVLFYRSHFFSDLFLRCNHNEDCVGVDERATKIIL